MSAMRPVPLHTEQSGVGASLPSPSLSPITAAANLSSLSGFEGNGGDDNDDESHNMSSFTLAQESPLNLTDENPFRRSLLDTSQLRPDFHRRRNGDGVRQLPTPTLVDIPAIIDSFDAMPEHLRSHVMYLLLKRCAKPTLHFVADIVNPALKCDFLNLLPLELSMNVIRYLDYKSMCRAAQVSKRWRRIVDSDEKAWRDLLRKDRYQVPAGEIERAIREGWGWQHSRGLDDCEKDISLNLRKVTKAEQVNPLQLTPTSFVDSEDSFTSSTSWSRTKRKSSIKLCNSRRQRRKISPDSKFSEVTWTQNSDNAQGPNTFANVAAATVINPHIGLPSLRSLHLFKSLYQRHHLIRKSWMQLEMQPQHLAFRAHQRNVVTCLQFDSDKILTGSDDTNINVYETQTGALRKRLEGHEGGVWALQYEGNILVSGSTDRSVRVWDIEEGKCLQVFQGHTSTVRCLIILKPVEVGKTFDGEPIMMPKETLIITGSRDSTLRVWKLPRPGDKSIIQSGPSANDYDNPYFIRTLTGHHHSVRAIAAHGDTLVSGSYDCSVRVWKISTGEALHRLQGHTQKVYSIVLDHARRRCISGSMDNLVKVWSLDTGMCLFNLEGHTSLVGLLDLSHERLVSAAADSTLRIWDPENGQCKSTLTAHTGAITCFQHDSQKVISGSDRTLKMWNIRTGECIKDLLSDLSGVWQVKFNDRRCVAAVQRNNVTYIEV